MKKILAITLVLTTVNVFAKSVPLRCEVMNFTNTRPDNFTLAIKDFSIDPEEETVKELDILNDKSVRIITSIFADLQTVSIIDQKSHIPFAQAEGTLRLTALSLEDKEGRQLKVHCFIKKD